MAEKIQLMIDGGKAGVTPQLAQALGPKGINIGEVIAKINEKTTHFKGMKIPVTVEVDGKNYTITAGTPPVSELIKKEAGIDKGSGEPNMNKVANIGIEQVVKISLMKQDSILHNSFTSVVKSVVGSCSSLGVLVEGKTGKEVCGEIDNGKYKHEIDAKVTEVPNEKKERLDNELKSIQTVLQKEKERKAAEEEAKKAAEEAKKAEAAPGGVKKAEAAAAPGTEVKKEAVPAGKEAKPAAGAKAAPAAKPAGKEAAKKK
ncbi:50S ribosomal protein L11 [Candidatus Woesearchaeota archaeon]|nr:50S ribosomal protein L11 [Candidatus Woesearchaeota archaeon]